MRLYREQIDAGRVNACDNQVRADVPLVLEEVLFELGDGGDDAGGTAGGEGV